MPSCAEAGVEFTRRVNTTEPPVGIGFDEIRAAALSRLDAVEAELRELGAKCGEIWIYGELAREKLLEHQRDMPRDPGPRVRRWLVVRLRRCGEGPTEHQVRGAFRNASKRRLSTSQIDVVGWDLNKKNMAVLR